MKHSGQKLSVLIGAFALLFGLIGPVSAQKNLKQVRDLVRSLNSQLDTFQYSLANELRSDPSDRSLQNAAAGLRNLQDKVTSFDLNVSDMRENRDDVNDIIDAAGAMDGPLLQSQPNQRLQFEWNEIKATIGKLSANYGVTPNWSGTGNSVGDSQVVVRNPAPGRPGGPPILQRAASASGLTGTYKLDTTRSENTDQILSETNVDGAQRQDLQQKLEAPPQIAIDIRGNQVTLASSIATPVTFSADGTDKTETDANGKSIHVRATLKGQELTLSSLGGDNDYTLIFAPIDGGNSLKVTRRITTDYLSETVFADSVYQKTDAVARLGIDNGSNSASSNTETAQDQNSGGWSSNDQNNPGSNSGSNNTGTSPAVSARTGEYIVPNRTVLTGLLETTIDTKVSHNNDRFSLTVQSPDEFRGAVIEGYVSGVGRSGRISGSSNVTFNFEKITMRDGKTYDFAGFLQSIRDQHGKPVKVDSEGTVHGNSQTKQTAKRGGAGAGIGALIGAIAGGGPGAAVGAIIGGSVGAGSVIVQGKDDIQLMKGSVITIQSSSPIHDNKPTE